MTKAQQEQARARIRKYYVLSRNVTDTEIEETIAMVRRHNLRGTMDDSILALYGTLSTGPYSVRDMLDG